MNFHHTNTSPEGLSFDIQNTMGKGEVPPTIFITEVSGANQLLLSITNHTGAPLKFKGGSLTNITTINQLQKASQSALLIDFSSLFHIVEPIELERIISRISMTLAGWESKLLEGRTWCLSPVKDGSLAKDAILTVSIGNVIYNHLQTADFLNLSYFRFGDHVADGDMQLLMTVRHLTGQVGRMLNEAVQLKWNDNNNVIIISESGKPVKNNLAFTLTNISGEPIQGDPAMDESPRFELEFVSAEKNEPGILASKQKVDQIKVSIKQAYGINWEVEKPEKQGGNTRLLTPVDREKVLGIGEQRSIAIGINDLLTTYAAGFAMVKLHYYNLLGFQNGTLFLFIEKRYFDGQLPATEMVGDHRSPVLSWNNDSNKKMRLEMPYPLVLGNGDAAGNLVIYDQTPSIRLESKKTPSGSAALRGMEGTWLIGYNGKAGEEDISIGTQNGKGSRTITFAAGGSKKLHLDASGNLSFTAKEGAISLENGAKIMVKNANKQSVPGLMLRDAADYTRLYLEAGLDISQKGKRMLSISPSLITVGGVKNEVTFFCEHNITAGNQLKANTLLKVNDGAEMLVANSAFINAEGPTKKVETYLQLCDQKKATNMGISERMHFFIKDKGQTFSIEKDIVRVGSKSSKVNATLIAEYDAVVEGLMRCKKNLLVEGGFFVKIAGKQYKLTKAGVPFNDASNIWPSDLQLKKGIEPIQQASAQLRHINGVRFSWNAKGIERLVGEEAKRYVVSPDATAKENASLQRQKKQELAKEIRGQQIGLVAQEVEAVFPELVETDAHGYKNIDYAKLSAVLVQALNEQGKEIERLAGVVEGLSLR